MWTRTSERYSRELLVDPSRYLFPKWILLVSSNGNAVYFLVFDRIYSLKDRIPDFFISIEWWRWYRRRTMEEAVAFDE